MFHFVSAWLVCHTPLKNIFKFVFARSHACGMSIVISSLFTWNRQKMRNRWLGSSYAPSLILSNSFLLRLYEKICFKKLQHFCWRQIMRLHRTGPSESVNAIRSAHNSVSHYESTHVLGPIPRTFLLGHNCHNIMCPIRWALVALHNAEKL